MTFNELDPLTRCLALIGAITAVMMFLVPMLAVALERIGALTPSGRKAFMVFASLLVLYAGAKHPLVVQEKPPWLSVTAEVPDDATNDFSRIEFRWEAAPGAIVPASTPLVFWAALQGTTNFFQIAENVYGDRSNVVWCAAAALVPNPTNFVYLVTSELSPDIIEITDLKVRASETSRYVRVSFTAPTNLYEAVAYIHARVKEAGQPFTEVGRISTVVKTNTVTITGDFISGGKDREFRAILEKEEEEP